MAPRAVLLSSHDYRKHFFEIPGIIIIHHNKSFEFCKRNCLRKQVELLKFD
jgi:hypothetical protein